MGGCVTDNSPDTAGINRVTVYLYRRNAANTGYEYRTGAAWSLFASSSQAKAGGAERAVTINGSSW